jgi:hypothetical protein
MHSVDRKLLGELIEKARGLGYTCVNVPSPEEATSNLLAEV